MLANKEIILVGSNYSFKKIMYCTGYYFIATVLLFSGISKIIDPQPLLDTLTLIKFLSEETRILIATALPILEITFTILLLGKIKVKITLVLTSVLFFGFLAFSIYGTLAGFDADCGCFGNTIKSEIGWGMVGRNLFMLLLSIININRVK